MYTVRNFKTKKVVKIELDFHVRLADLGDDVGGLLDAGEKIVRPVARIDRLDQARDVVAPRQIRRARDDWR